MDNEYQNLYLNDLIIKISFKNNQDNHRNFQNFIYNLKNLNVKIKNNEFHYEKIKSLVDKEKNKVKELLKENTIMFYTLFSKLIQNL